MSNLSKALLYRASRNVSTLAKQASLTHFSVGMNLNHSNALMTESTQHFSVKPLNVGGMSNDLLVSLSMNHNNSGTTHAELCDNLRRNNLISTPLLEYSFRKADRAIFDPSELPYEDKPHSIGGGATITSAHMHAIALEALVGAMIPDTPPTNLAFLDVGSGSGFVTGVMGMLIHTMSNSAYNKEHNDGKILGHVVGADIVPQLIEQSTRNLRALLPALANDPDMSESSSSPICSLVALDAFNEVVPHGPFDAIHVGVAAVGTPYKLLSQLKVEGKAVIPVYIQGTPEQDLLVFTRKTSEDMPSNTEELTSWVDRAFTRKSLMRCMYSPPIEINAIPQDAAIDPRGEVKSAPDSKFSKFFKSDTTVRETPEAAAQRRKQAKAQEMSELRLKLTSDLEVQNKALQVTGDEVKAWHAKYFAQEGKHPNMAIMKEDPIVSKLLDVVHDLRQQIQKNERALKALNQ